MIKCKLCGGTNADKAVYCASCGSKLADQLKPKNKPTINPGLNGGVDLNLPFSFYKDYMSEKDLYNVALARLDGAVLKKDENEGISILVYLAEKGYLPALLKLADLCLKDTRTFNEAVILLKKAADCGSLEALEKLHKMGIKYKGNIKNDPKDKPKIHPSPRNVIDDDDDDDDDFDEPDDRYDLENVIEKTVAIKTKTTNSKTIYSIGFIAEAGYIVSTYDAINRGSYKSIVGSLNDGNKNFYKMKPIKISKKLNIVLLKFVDDEFEDVDYFDSLELSDDFEKGDVVYAIGLHNKSIEIEKCKIVEYMTKDLTSAVKKAIKLKGDFDSEMVTPLLVDENGGVIGIIFDIHGGKAYAAPSKYIFKVIEEAVED